MEGRDPPKRGPLPLSALDDEAPTFQPPRERTKLTPYAPAPQAPLLKEELPPSFTPQTAGARFGATKPTPYTREDIEAAKAASPALRAQGAESSVVMAEPFVPRGYGDRAREHLAIKRPRVSAWVHVVVAYFVETAALGLALAFVAGRVAAAVGYTGNAGLLSAPGAAGATLGALLAYLVFRDRFHCVEAVASRYVVDAAFISILWVPFVALAYANVRGARKLVGR